MNLMNHDSPPEKSFKMPAHGSQDLPMPDYHPCEVAKSAGGIFGPIGGGEDGPPPDGWAGRSWGLK